MSGASRYAAELTMVRLTPGARPGDTTRVERVARTGLAREVLVDRALPLLRRARRLADRIADIEGGGSAQQLADDIAALIGHDVTDQPPAPELEAILAEGTPCRLTWEAWQALSDEARAQVPAAALPLELAVETPAEREARYEKLNEALEGLGIEVIPPCPMAPYAESSDWEQERAAAVPFMGPESSEPATPAYQPLLGPGDDAWRIGARR